MESTDNITLNRLLTTVARQGASDLHLTVGAPPVIRKEGVLYQLDTEEIISVHFLDRVIGGLLEEQQKAELEKEKEVTFMQTFNKIQRFRVTLYKQKGNFAMALRFVPLMNKKVADLGLPQYLEQAIRYKTGLILICGAYDSGKSTTAAAVINTLNEEGPPRYITTLEQPVEYLFANNKCIIEQREIGRDVISYAQGLKLAVEADIDMVFIDRIVEERAAKRFFEVLEAGRSVLSTLTATSSINALNKLVSFISPSEQAWVYKVLANRLQCIVLQKLVHKMGGGRALAYEFLPNLGMVQSSIQGGALERLDTVLKTSKEAETTPIEESLARLVQKGEVKLDEALLEAPDKIYLKRLLRGA